MDRLLSAFFPISIILAFQILTSDKVFNCHILYIMTKAFLSFISYAVIAYSCAECPKLSCGRKGCETEFCYHCRQLWHPDQTCDQARRQRARHTSGANDVSTLYVFNEEPGGMAQTLRD